MHQGAQQHQRTERLKVSYVFDKTLKIDHFCTLNEILMIPGALLGIRKEGDYSIAI